jgi:integrase
MSAKRRHFGSVRKLPSGRWQASWWHEGERHTAESTFDQKADALAHLSTVETDLRRGVWLDPRTGKVTLTDFGETWLRQRVDAKRLSERTEELYRWLFSKHIEPSLGDVEISKLKPGAVRAWHARLAATRHTTAAKAYRLLAAMMKTAVADGLVAQSPCRIEGAALERPEERQVASAAQVAALTAAMPPNLRAVVLLATWCQLRRGEILGLRRRDIDVDEQLLIIEETRVTAMSGKVVVKAPKTAAGRRTIAIPRHIVDALGWHIERFVGQEADSLIFDVTSRMLDIAWTRARVEVGMEGFRLHDLRHTGLTWAAEAGASVAELMRRGGHASPVAALRYQHATDDHDRAIADALADRAAHR